MNLEVRRVPLDGRPLSVAYLTDYERVAHFYAAGAPHAIASYREAAVRAREAYPDSRWQALAESIRPEDPQAAERLKEVVERRGLFVATGQQAGLFTGPLLTLYKALTAARLAADLEGVLDTPVMPLFTIASEDHDWDEVNHTQVIDLENRYLRIAVHGRVEGEGEGEGEGDRIRPPVYRIPVGADAEIALDQLSQSTPETEFKADVLAPLRAAYRSDAGMAEAFEAALGHLLRRHPFLIVQACHPFVKAMSRDLLWSEWEKRAQVHQRLEGRGKEIEAAGFALQVGLSDGLTNLFVEGALGRDRVVGDGSGARLRRSGEVLTADELRELLEKRPDRVSPGVLLRPLAEATAFPVVAYVAGPAEIAYLAQSDRLFDLHGIPSPVVAPRASLQLIEPKIERILKKYKLDAEQLSGDAAQAIGGLLKDQMPADLADSLQALRSSVEAALGPVESAATGFDAGSRSAVERGKSAIFQGIESLERKLLDRVKEKHEIMRQQLEKVAVHLFPGGQPQERVLNIYPYLVRYGEEILEAVYDSVQTRLE